MAPDFPSDLIRDIQIGLRHAAGIPSYDPGDPAIPSVPSIEEAVGALDPSLPDYLRCKRCHGGLCRGINSTLCIFCGAEQRVEGISRTISFKSTAGCRKFLQSLDLNGSEIVNFEAESKNSVKGQDSPKGSITLLDILDLELIWPRHVDESDNSSSSKAPSQLATMSLSGINLDNFFSAQNKNEVSSRSNSSQTTSNDPQTSPHDAYLSSVHLDTDLSYTRNETAAIAWNTAAMKAMPRETDVNPPVNLSSSSQKFIFLEGRSLDSANSFIDAKVGDAGDIFTDWETDFQSASSVTFEGNSKSTDSFQNYADFQSTSSATATLEPVQIDPFHNTSTFHSVNTIGFTKESRTIDPFQNFADFKSTNFETVTTDFMYTDLFRASESQSTVLGKFGTNSRPTDHLKSSGNEKLDQSTIIGDNAGKAWFKDDMSSHISTKVLKEADQLESISSTSVGEDKDEEKDDFFLRSSANEINNGKALNHHDDGLIDDWQDFATSISALDNSLERKSGELEDLDFGSFVQSDSISGAINDMQSSSDINSIVADDSAAKRMNQSNEKTGNASIYRDLDVSKDIPIASNYEVNMLLAQMPDLSFMLEESLCIPKKPSSSELNT